MMSSRIIQVGQKNLFTVPTKLFKISVNQSINPRMFSVLNYKSMNHNNCGVTKSFSYLIRRDLSIQRITNNIQLYTKEPRNFVIDAKTLRLKQDLGNRPLTLILPFLGAQQKHLKKYANIYHNQGFDVVVGQISSWDMLVPAFTTQLTAMDIVKFLQNNDYYDKILIHGFSVGAYLYGECILHMLKDMQKYRNIFDRVQGEIWDSLPNFHEIAIGISRSVFVHNLILQNTLEYILEFYLRTFPSLTADYVKTGSNALHYTKDIHSPCLFFFSKSDIVSVEAGIRRSIALFQEMNVKCTWKCFDKSPHVQHYRFHREEYTQALIGHLNKVKMLKEQRTMLTTLL